MVPDHWFWGTAKESKLFFTIDVAPRRASNHGPLYGTTSVAPNVQPPNVQHCPQWATFFWAICVLSRVPTLRKNFNSKMTKMNGNGFNVVFKMIKLTSKAVFYHLYQTILPLFTINWLCMVSKGFRLSISSGFLCKYITSDDGKPKCFTTPCVN